MKKIVSFYFRGSPEWGILTEDENGIYRVADLEEMLFIPLPETIEDLIEKGKEGLVTLAAALTQLRDADERIVKPISINDIELDIPLRTGRNIICVGKNYRAHIEEFDKKKSDRLPDAPIYFTKSPDSLLASGKNIPVHENITAEIDYEGELAVIIGDYCENIRPEEAADYIFGYTIINDVTARDLQRERGQWFYGKSLRGFCPVGPYILIGPQTEPFRITTTVNGEIRQDASTEDLIFSIPELIADLSRAFNLSPGDIIATGTPSGVGMGFEPPRFLHKGDEVEINIDTIGTLRNTL